MAEGPQGVAVRGIIRRGGLILLLRRSSGSVHDPGRWDLPGGKLEYGERLTDALRRETLDEAGIEVAIGDLCASWHHFTDDVWVTGVTFACDFENGDVALSHEHDAHAWIDPRDAVEYDLAPAVEEQIGSYLGRL
jgi:8-oxo-dGTP diphosphatase